MGKPTREEILNKVREAGVVGAGGAGFPAHRKLDCSVDRLIVNIAECEPLICKDKEIARSFPERIVHGAEMVMQVTGARQSFFALKGKHATLASVLKARLKSGMSVSLLDDYYPAGDEVLLTYDVTGRIVREGKLPISEGVLVSNAETLYNISLAMESQPVTEKFLTIAGAVKEPVTVKVPVGIVLRDLLDHFNIPSDGYVAFADGVMMGTLVEDSSLSIAKTTSGIVMLPEDHPLVSRRRRSENQDIRIVRSACDQCSYCTDYCPRYLLGHWVEPHRIMRTLSLSRETEYPDYARGCVECNLCTLFACPEDLSPDIIMKAAKRQQAMNTQRQSRGIHPMREFRKVPSSRLIRRLSLESFDTEAPFAECNLKPHLVKVSLVQHTGTPALPEKKEGARVTRGERVASPAKDAIGAPVHASISGTITRITASDITIERTEGSQS
jgi:Na+-translocating ferredoxin:NAD+ oxidoreductase RnfC subunit